MVSDRSLQVLRAIVEDYVETREPVASKTIVEKHSFGVSAATIRNDMAQLEEEELIAAPHTSSGRVPTDKGYRVFVDRLSEVRPLSAAQKNAIERFLGESGDLDDILSRTVRLLAQLTNQVAVVQYPSLSTNRVRHIEFVAVGGRRILSVLIADNGVVEQRIVDPGAEIDAEALLALRARVGSLVVGLGMGEAARALEGLLTQLDDASARVVRALLEQVGANHSERIVMAGAANLVRTERDFVHGLFPLLEAIEEQVILLRLFAELQPDERGVAVRIGSENAPYGLAEASVLASGYAGSGTDVARLGVIGPTRMDYSANMATVRAVARYLARLVDGDR